jgi:hypothetical protein
VIKETQAMAIRNEAIFIAPELKMMDVSDY